MKQNKHSISRIKQIIQETIQNETDSSSYYVHSSSYFDQSGYDISKVKDAVKHAGGLNVRLEKSKGLDDEQFFVVFEVASDGGIIEDIAKNVAQLLNSNWVYIKKMVR